MTMGILSKAKTVGVPKCDLDYDVASCHPLFIVGIRGVVNGPKEGFGL